jgi:hypothetical protein
MCSDILFNVILGEIENFYPKILPCGASEMGFEIYVLAN